ncbi:MAG: MFS transporter [Candidatus Dormibacteria bacterium]
MAVDVDPGVPTEGMTGAPIHTDPAPPSVSVASPSGDSTIVRYYAGFILSFLGDWLTTVALVVVLFELTGNPAAPAGYVLVRAAPRVTGPWMGGALADRFTPRLVMLVTAAWQGGLSLSLVAFHRAAFVPGIYVAVGIAQFLGAISRPAQSAMVAGIVSGERLARANAVISLLLGASLFAGPAVGALLIVPLGPDPLFEVDAITFVAAAALAVTLPSIRVHREIGARVRASEGIARALRDPLIRMVGAGQMAMSIIITSAQAMLVVAAHDKFGGDARVGFLYASVGVGTTLGAIYALRRQPAYAAIPLVIAVTVAGDVVCVTAFPLAPTLIGAMTLLAMSSLFGGWVDIWGATAIQRRAPHGYMARFNSVPFLGMYTGALVGASWSIAGVHYLSWDRVVEIAGIAAIVLAGVVIARNLPAALRLAAQTETTDVSPASPHPGARSPAVDLLDPRSESDRL